MKKQAQEDTSLIVKRLAEYMQLRRITKAQLAKELDMLQPTVNGYFLENSPSSRAMPLSFLEKVVTHFPDLDAEWLLRGKMKDDTPLPASTDDTDDVTDLKTEVKRLRLQNAMLTNSNATLTKLLANAINRG